MAKIKQKLSSKLFNGVIVLCVSLLCVTILIPFISLFFTSLSTSPTASMGSLSLKLDEVSFENYVTMLNNPLVWSGYIVTISRVVVGTALSLVFTSIGAYCMSKDYFPHRTFWMGMIVFTMFFGGGLVPTYLTYIEYGLKESFWSMILPGLVGAYNLVIMRNFFQQIPASIEESASIDGAGNLRILFTLIYPISLPVLATVGLWLAVGHWNAWFDCLIYIRQPEKFVAQIVLRRIVMQGTGGGGSMQGLGFDEDIVGNPDGLKAAAIFVMTFPILCLYPFLQKYFVKGIIVGSLKG